MKVQFFLALRYLNGRKLRSLLTTLAVLFGVMVIFGMNILIPSMMQSFQATILAASNNVDLTISLRSSESFPAAALDTLRGVEGVRLAQGVLSRPVNLPADFFDHDPTQPDRVSAVSLVGVEMSTAQAMHNYTVQSGRFLQPSDASACVISQSLADNLNLKAGDPLPLVTTQGVVNLTVAGILPPRAIPGNEEVLVTLPQAQLLLDADGKINHMEANFNTSDLPRRAAIQGEIEKRLGAGYQFGALSTGSDVFASIKLAEALFNAFGFLSLFMGGFIIFNTFRTLVHERRRDIGMLRAVGADRRMVTGLILIEGLIQGGVGTLLGMLLGYLFGAAAMASVSSILQTYIHIQPGAPVMTPGIVILSVVSGVGITLLAGLLPALSAGRVQPVEALRPAVASVENRRTLGLGAVIGAALMVLSALALLLGSTSLVSAGAFVFLIGLALLAPVLMRPIAAAFGSLFALLLARQGTGMLAQGSLTRQPTRTAVTASTTMIALAILVVVGGMTTSLTTGFTRALEVSLGSDYLFVPPSIAMWNTNVGASSRFAEDLKAVPGVGPLSSFRFANATAEIKPALPAKGQPQSGEKTGLEISMLGIDPVTYPQVSGLEFSEGSPAKAYKDLGSGRMLIINGILATTAGLKVGDTVPLVTPTGRQDYRVAAVGTDFLNVKILTAYISQANLAADFGKTEDVFIQLNLLPGADRAAVEEQLKAVKQTYPQFTMISGEKYLKQSIDLFRTAFAGLYVLFVFLAVPSLIAMLNTLAIGVIERTREIGMIRAVGATQKQIGRMILAEALLLAGVGTVFGLLAGLYLDYAMMTAFQMGGFPIQFIFPFAGLLFATLTGLLFGALAAVIPARRASQLEIVQALRYE